MVAIKVEKKSVQCPDCSQRITRSADLNRHRRTHHDPNISCGWKGCTKMFRQKSNMVSHVNAVHYGLRLSECPHSWIDIDGVVRPCKRAYKEPSSLTRHRQTKHGYVPRGIPQDYIVPTPMDVRFSHIRELMKQGVIQKDWLEVDLEDEPCSSVTSEPPRTPRSIPRRVMDSPAVVDSDDIGHSMASSRSSSSSPLASTSRLGIREHKELLVEPSKEIRDLAAFLAGSNIPPAFAAIMAQKSSTKTSTTQNEQITTGSSGSDRRLDVGQFQSTPGVQHAPPPAQPPRPDPQAWSYTPGVVPAFDDPVAYDALPAPAPIPARAALPSYGIMSNARGRIPANANKQKSCHANTNWGNRAGTYTPSPSSLRRSPASETYSHCFPADPQGYSHGSGDAIAIVPPQPSVFNRYYRG